MDENQISVPCPIQGCTKRVVGDTRCKNHGGRPTIELTESIWGEVRYSVTHTPGRGTS